jgi:F-type H+-transporting ATPase subunit delta
MADHQGQTEPLADVYAEALVSAASEQGQDEAVAEEFGDLVRYLDTDAEFERFLTGDAVDDDPRRQSLERIFRGRMSDLLLNLLQVLNHRGRLELVRDVYRCVQLRMEAKHREQEVVVETAMPLNDELRTAIRSDVGAQIGRQVLLIEELRPELIGGVVIRFGDVQVDGSVASQIQRTYKRLCERATEEIHGGRGYALEA